MSIEADAELAALAVPPTKRGPLYNAVAIVTIVATFGMMLHVVVNALMRSFLSKPIYGTLEYTQFWYVPAIAALGIALAQLNNEHIEARLLFDRLPRVVQPFADIATRLLTIIVFVLFTGYGFVMALESFEIGRTAGVSGVIIWPATFFLPISFAVAAVILCFQLTRTIRTLRADAAPKIEENPS